MKIKKLLVIFFVFGSIVVSAQQGDVDAVLEAAHIDCMNWLSKIPPGHEEHYGFSNRQEFSGVSIGKPYQILLLNKAFYIDSLHSGGNYLIPGNEWRVAVSVGKENKVMLTVSKVQGKWKVVGLGAAELGREVGTFDIIHPSEANHGTILRVLDLNCEFLLTPADNETDSLRAYFLKSSAYVFEQPDDFVNSWPLDKVLLSLKNMIGNKNNR